MTSPWLRVKFVQRDGPEGLKLLTAKELSGRQTARVVCRSKPLTVRERDQEVAARVERRP